MTEYMKPFSHIYVEEGAEKYNRTVIEYVVMHEYCHLKYKTHSKKFLEMIEKNQKNYKKIENLITKYKF